MCSHRVPSITTTRIKVEKNNVEPSGRSLYKEEDKIKTGRIEEIECDIVLKKVRFG